MTVYKATRRDMTCTMGQGRFTYRVGIPAAAASSKCGITGLHACEYVLDCTRYYRIGGGNRFFLAEAEGDIAEDGRDTRISCTKLTLLRELTNREMAGRAMVYMLLHPQRDGWKASGHMVEAADGSAWAQRRDGIAIARGLRPLAGGVMGSHIGLVLEEGGSITAARLFTVGRDGVRPDTWYTLGSGGTLKEAGDET